MKWGINIANNQFLYHLHQVLHLLARVQALARLFLAKAKKNLKRVRIMSRWETWWIKRRITQSDHAHIAEAEIKTRKRITRFRNKKNRLAKALQIEHLSANEYSATNYDSN
jgi:hypothetical protein